MTSLLTLTLLASSTVFAADVGTYKYTETPNLSSAAISQFNSSANVSSTDTFDSIIYESPFNLTTSHPEYTLTLAISEQASKNTSDSSLTESLLFITPPVNSGVAGGNLSNIRDWYSCAVIFKRISDAATRRGENEDGGCFPTLGKKCIDALNQQVIDAGKEDSQVACESLISSKIPPECSEAITGTESDILTFDLNPSSSNSTNPIPLLLITSEPHSPTNNSYFDEATHHIWPVLVYQKVSSGDPDKDQSASSAQMMCLRDKDAKKSGSGGTQTSSPTPSPTSTNKPGAGAKLGVEATRWVMMMTSLVGVLVLLF